MTMASTQVFPFRSGHVPIGVRYSSGGASGQPADELGIWWAVHLKLISNSLRKIDTQVMGAVQRGAS